MIPYSYNMVDMGGIDLAEANGTVVEGLYNRLALARNACGDLILFNWKFAEIEIAPAPCSTLDEGTTIVINGLIQVTEQDEVIVPGINPDPVIVPLAAQENGVYQPPSGVDGFAPVTVSVENDPYPEKMYIINPNVLAAVYNNGQYTGQDAGGNTYYRGTWQIPVIGKLSSSSSTRSTITPIISTYDFGSGIKPCIYRDGWNLGCFVFPSLKIPAGVYSKLFVRITVQSGYANSYTNCAIILTPDPMPASSVAGSNELKRIWLANPQWTPEQIMEQEGAIITGATSDRKIPPQIVEIDISDISQDFYFAMFDCDRSYYIGEVYATNKIVS